MKPNKRLAALTAAAIAVSGVAAITVASSAEASSQNFTVYSQINNSALAGPAQVGLKNVALTQTPASPAVGSAIEVQVTSSDMSFNNGPASPTTLLNAELDAVITLNGVDYTLRGSRNNIAVNTGATNRIFDAGWVVSSTAGNSVATSTNVTAPAGGPTAGTTGIGATVRGAEATPVSLLAPAAAGTYTIGLKALVNNSLSASVNLTDPFDNIYGTDATGWVAGCGPSGAGCAGNIGMGDVTGAFATNATNGTTATNGNFVFTVPVSFTAVGPNGAIVTSQGQNAGVQAARFSAAYSTALTLSGNTFAPSIAAGSVTAAFCNNVGASCDAPVPGVTVNTLATDGAGLLSGGITVQGAGITTGNRFIKVTAGASVGLIPVLVLAPATITISQAGGGAGTVLTVSGSNFNPSQAGIIRGAITNAPPFTTTADPSVPVTADAAGAISGSFTVNAGTTAAVLASQGPGFPLGPNNASGSQPFAFSSTSCTADTGNVNTGNCNTAQTAYATVLAGNLSQAAAAAPGNGFADQIVFCKTAAPVVPAGGTQPGNTLACGLSSPLAATPMFATLNPVTVTDTRGGNFGWSLTATMPNLSDGTHSMLNSAVAITPACASVNAGSAPGAVAGGAGQTFAGTVSLCVKDTQISAAPLSQTTGGQWEISAPLTLTVPSFQAAGQYNSIVTVNLA